MFLQPNPEPIDGPVFQRFADESPMAVIAAILLARVFSPEKLDELFEQVRTKQYTQDLLFSTIFDLTDKVVCAIEPSVHSAYPHYTTKMNGVDLWR